MLCNPVKHPGPWANIRKSVNQLGNLFITHKVDKHVHCTKFLEIPRMKVEIDYFTILYKINELN